jgi:4-amino-4-deoxy-L-arabinose transferase-like glycosyltransferase
LRYSLSLWFTILVCLAALILAVWRRLRRAGGSGRLPEPGRRLGALLFWLIFALGVAVRVYRFGEIPNGLYVDEAAVGYNAYALLHYGVDFNGFSNPVIFVTFGSGQHALYGYLSMPFIALLGLNVVSTRLAALALGVMSLEIFYLLVLRTDGEWTALAALFVLAINPWHIMISRWGLDCNPFPAVFLLATYFLACALEQSEGGKGERFFLLAMALYGVSLYAYGTAYFVVPIFVLLVSAWLLMYRKIRVKTLLAGCAVLGGVGLPIVLYVAVNAFGWNSIQTSWFSIPHMPGPARYTMVSVFFAEGGFLKALTDNAMGLARLLISQNDRLIWNSMPGFGVVYLFSLPLAALGLWAMVREWWGKGHKFQTNSVFVLWLAAAVCLGLVMPVIVNRINILFLPLIYLVARGLSYLRAQSRLLASAAVVLMLAWFGLFCSAYFHGYTGLIGTAMNESLDEAIHYAAQHAAPGETVYVTDRAHFPYVYVLFYQRSDPREFLNSVVYSDPDASFRHAVSFGRYRFSEDVDMPLEGGGAYVVDNRESGRFPSQRFEVHSFKYYSAVLPRPQ